MSSARVVDVHAHLALPDVDGLVGGRPEQEREVAAVAARLGPASAAVSAGMLGDVLPQLTDTGLRLAAMDVAGVDVQVLSPSPTQYTLWADRALSTDVWTAANEGVAKTCAAAPDRFVGLGLVPLQHPDLTMSALEHAVVTCGLRGVEISSYAPSDAGHVDLSHPDLEPMWTRAEELGAVVFLHPLGCTVDGRLDRWYLENVVGQPLEHTIALYHLVFAGVLDRHPGLRLLAAHGGGYFPVYGGRADRAWAARPEARTCDRPPSSYLDRLHVDSLVHSAAGLRTLVEVMGADRVLLGSDYPFDMGVRDVVGGLDDAGLTAEERWAVAGGNAARLGLVP